MLVAGRRWWKPDFGLDSLAAAPVVDYYQSSPLIHRWIAHHYRRKAPRLQVRVWAATTDLALELILKGAGVGVLPRNLVLPYLKTRRLRVVETGRAEVVDFIWMKELANAYRGPALSAFRSSAIEGLAPG